MNKLIFKNKANVIITEKLQAQITCLHNQCPQGKEWSGLVVYKITSGVIRHFLNEQDNLELTCEDLFPMDFGDATFTSFEAGVDYIKFFELYPQVDPTREDKGNSYYYGKVHSHQAMSSKS